MQPARLIDGLRQGIRPSDADLRAFALGLGDGSVSDAQAGAFAMAVCLQGLGDAGRVALTLGMRDSGQVLKWGTDRPVLDKHSTGGVGDAVSLILAPMLAACDVHVPMISGRGLGHTGGTLDKLEAVPGVNTSVSVDVFQKVVRRSGCAIVAATPDIAPADRRLYAVRDVTGTVQSVDLITASILSKKLAAGLAGLVLDVKVGSGAFMKSLPEARRLAQALVDTANGAGCPTRALITDMSQPLLPALGNATEMELVLKILTGEPSTLTEVALALGAEVLHLGGVTDSQEAGEAKLKAALRSGAAYEHFMAMLSGLGAKSTWSLPQAPYVIDVPSPTAGLVRAIDGEALGHVVVSLGGGRKRARDVIDPSVGLTDLARLGARVDKGDPLARIHAKHAQDAHAVLSAVTGAFTFGAAFTPFELILETVV